MAATCAISVRQSLVAQGAPDLVTLTWSGGGTQTVSAVGWLGKPPYFSDLVGLVGTNIVNGTNVQQQFTAKFESSGTTYDAAHNLIVQYVMPWILLSDNTMVVPSCWSNLPPVNPAYAVGTNPPQIICAPTLDAPIETSQTTGRLYKTGKYNYTDLNLSYMLGTGMPV